MTDTDPIKKTTWHAMPAEKVMEDFGCTRAGLTAPDVEERVQKYGPNRLRPPKSRGPIMRFIAQFHNVLIYVLLAAAGAAALLGDWLDAGVILGVVIVNSLIGFIQEGKAEKALDAIRNMLSPNATVLRDGKKKTIPAEELVPGDIVFLQAGDKVSADLRLIELRSLQIDEAILTGESVPVSKKVDPADIEAVLGDRRCMGYSGTLVTQGQGSGVVIATGEYTEIGRISQMISGVHTLMTPLLRQMAQFGRWLTGAILVLAGFTFAYGYLINGSDPKDMFAAAVGLAVAAIPEGLPAVMTVALAIGVQRMVRRHSIIRRLPAVETLGSVTVICSDKTGTLTRNEMTAKALITADADYEIGGTGYEPQGEFTVDGKEIAPNDIPVLQEIVRASLLCNESSIHEIDGEWKLNGDPTEGALMVLAMKTGSTPEAELEAFPRVDVIPFDSKYQYMATLNRHPNGQHIIYMKGAPDRLLEMCTHQQTANGAEPLKKDFWIQHLERVAARGQRLLAIAWKEVSADVKQIDHGDVEAGLTLLGVCGIIDPPRQEAIEAVRECHEAGINVKMITGDYAITANAIAEELGIGIGKEAVSGADLEHMTDEQLRELVPETDVFARSSPEHKLRLVQALQANRHVVAMTGDGVNDAPALKQANVGVAMGMKGTEAAKEASEMVITDDNFRSIVNAVEEGRAVYDNLKKTIMFILPVNGGESMMILAAIVLGIGAVGTHINLPITAVQILWVNMMSSVLLALALAFEPMEPGVMKRPPRKPGTPILSSFLLWRILFVSLLLVVGPILHFQHIIRSLGGLIDAAGDLRADVLAVAQSAAVNTLVFGEIAYLFNSRYLNASSLRRESIFGNRIALFSVGSLVLIQMLFTYFSPIQTLFGTGPLPAAAWGRIVIFAILVFLLVEAEKAIGRMLLRKPAAKPAAIAADIEPEPEG